MMGVLALILAVIALVIAVIVYVRDQKHNHKAADCCKKNKSCLCKLTTRVAADEANANSVIGSYSFVGVITGTTSTTPLSILNAVGPPNDVVDSPFAGTVTAISVAVRDVPTTGSVTVFITKNNIATSLSVTIDSFNTSQYVTALASVPFVAGDLIGISFTSDSVAFPQAPAIITAQAFVNYTA